MKYLLKQRPLILVWLAWALIMVGYQIYVSNRFELARPDYALFWTPQETSLRSQSNKPYLLEPFANNHVAWDSEYYISIALAGYDDPAMRAIPANFTFANPQIKLKGDEPTWTSLNYAFFPFYPLVMRLLISPFKLFGLNPIAAASLAGLVVSLLGTLAAMLALADMTLDDAGEAGGLRAAFYMLIWPAGMFLAQVYTEGLFLGLSFTALALARRDKWLWAILLAVLATWTRPLGLLLVVPLVLYWIKHGHFKKLRSQFSWAEAGRLLLLASPILAYLLWNAALGQSFQFVEAKYFARGLLALGPSLYNWYVALQQLVGTNPQGQAYYLVEFAAILFSFVACALMWKYDKVLVIYSLAVIVLSLMSGVAQGMHRYVMAAPVVFILPARWGKNNTFDRIWTLGNVLLMGVFAAMFTFNFWAG